MEKIKIERAKDRALLLAKEPVLSYPAENIAVNAPVAIHQIAFQNELNGILLGLGLAHCRVVKLPITNALLREIRKAINDYGNKT